MNKICILQGSPNTVFFWNALKKTTEYFLKFLFLFEITILPVNKRKYFHLNSCLQFLSTLSIVCSCISPMAPRILSFNYLWLVGVTLIFDGTLQIIVLRCQIAVSAGHAVAYTIGPIFKHIIDMCSCISPMTSRILSFKASIVPGLSV